LQDDLEAAAKWEEDWLMAFHPDKCNLLSITTKRKPEHVYYNLHGHILESVDSAKYLGITLQSNLKWNKHIDQTASIKKTHAYQALVRPKLEYCSSVWDPYTAENNYKLEKVQRRAVRYVCHRYHNTSSVTEMMDDLSWSTLKERCTKTRLINFYKISNNKMEIPYTDILIPN
jgi:myo-inositol-hexaphosphate 3-phosphohydrolase